MRRVLKGSTVLGTLAVAGAGAVLVVTVLQAMSVDPVVQVAEEAVPAAESGEERPEGVVRPAEGYALEGPGEARSGAGDPAAAWNDPLLAAVDNDPFSPGRRPPARRYQLPSEQRPVVREEPRERPEAPDFRIVGTASSSAGGLALVQSGGDPPRVMRLGESVGDVTRVEGEAPADPTALALVQINAGPPRVVGLGESVAGYRLAAVDAESATLLGPAGTLRYPVMEPAVRDDDDDRRRRRRGDDDDDERRAREAQQRLEVLRGRLQQMQIQNGVRGGFTVEGRRLFFPSGGAASDQPPPAPVIIRRRGGGGGVPQAPAP